MKKIGENTMRALSWLKETVDESSVRSSLQEMVDNEFSQRSVTKDLKTIYIFLTRKCNLGCQHCYIEGVGPNAKGVDFDFNTIRGLIEQARLNGLRKVKVSGGEPTIHKDFRMIMEYLGSIGLSEIVLETNGTLFKDDTIEWLEKIPNLTIFINLDHLDSEAHDHFRRRAGAFAKTAEVLQSLGVANIDSVVTTTAYRNNYNKIPQIIDLVLGWGINRHRTLLNIHPLGNARGYLDNAITLDECEEVISSLLELESFRNGQAYMTLPPALMPIKYLNGVHTCGWGDNVLGILSNGDISMCSASYDDPKMIGGNAYNRPLMDIWNNNPFFEELRQIGKVASRAFAETASSIRSVVVLAR
jgi:AdoMet-dependent heme synthase